MSKILQLKITLKHTDPAVFRTIQVSSKINFLKLHDVIQLVMLWENSHLHEFKFNEYRISQLFEESDADWSEGVIDSKEVVVGKVLTKGDKLTYEYDFGDSWIHDIIVEKEFPSEPGVFYPRCIDGAMQRPPEDCGGIPGYFGIIELMKGEKNDEYEEMVEWLGEPFDPTEFDLVMVNELLVDVFSVKKKRKKKK